MLITDNIKHSLFTSTGYSFDITVSNTFMDAENKWHLFKLLPITMFVKF